MQTKKIDHSGVPLYLLYLCSVVKSIILSELVLVSLRFFHTVPPRIIEEFSPSSVICEKQSPCFLTCQATSYIPFNYSWTKDGQVPTGDGIKLMNNSIIVTPRDGKDYGEYVCHATNSFGSTEYKITLLSPRDNQDDDGKYSSSIFERAYMLSSQKFWKA